MAIGAIVSGGLNLLGAGIQAIGSFGAAKKMRKFADRQTTEGAALDLEAERSRPEYETPEEIMARLNQARSEEAGTSRRQMEMERAADRTQASGVSGVARYATSGAQGLAALAALGDQRYANVSQAIMAGAQDRQIASQRADALGAQVSEFRDQEFEINELAPFIEKKMRAEELRRAGMRNQLAAIGAKAGAWSALGQGLSGASGAAGSLAGSMFGGKNKASVQAETGNSLGMPDDTYNQYYDFDRYYRGKND